MVYFFFRETAVENINCGKVGASNRCVCTAGYCTAVVSLVRIIIVITYALPSRALLYAKIQRTLKKPIWSHLRVQPSSANLVITDRHCWRHWWCSCRRCFPASRASVRATTAEFVCCVTRGRRSSRLVSTAPSPATFRSTSTKSVSSFTVQYCWRMSSRPSIPPTGR